MEDVSAEDPGWGRGAPPAWGRGAPRGRGRGAPQGRGRGNNPRRAINASSWRTRESEATEPRVIPQLRPMPPSPTVPFKDPQKPPKLWAIYCFDDYFNMQYEEEQLQNFTRTMMTKAREVGLIFEEPLVIKITLLQDIDDVKIFFNDLFLERRHFELLFIGIPEKFAKIETDEVYKYIKHYCDNEFGIISCCFKAAYIKKIPAGYFSNYLLKVNAKLGGVNDLFDPSFLATLPLSSRTMIVGVESQPFSIGKVATSLVVAEGSSDENFTRYTSEIRLQRQQANDIILALDSMLKELLAEYKLKNNQMYPETVIIYRSNLSRAQFAAFTEYELSALKRSLASKSPNSKLNVIIVQKRRSPGPPPEGRRIQFSAATVQDAEVKDTDEDVFDLTELFKIKDTAKSTKYIVFQNESNFTIDQLKRLTFYSCQNYARSKDKVDIPTCVRYADLCASRAKIHAQYKYDEMAEEGQLEEPGNSDDSLVKNLNSQIQLVRNVKNAHYFM